MIDLKIHCNIDASALAVQSNQARKVLNELMKEEMTDWLTLPEKYNKDEFERTKNIAKKIQSNSKYLVCVGIGGSYLGHKAIIEALETQIKSSVKILYAGNNLSTLELQKVFDEIGNDDFSINVISKSGTTTEPAIAFRILKKKLLEKYSEKEAYARIYVTTGLKNGILHDEALFNHYETFEIPDNIGGRYSVLTAVGLLPMAVAGIDIDELMFGAREEEIALRLESTNDNEIANSISEPIFRYASIRHILRTRGYDTEILASFEPCLEMLGKWWQQLFGESEGKNNQSIFPAFASYTADLHSIGQYMQQGRENIFETVMSFKNAPTPKYTNRVNPEIIIEQSQDNLDNLDYLADKTLNFINEQAKNATILAHLKHIPVIELIIPELSARNLGALIYFFEVSCALSGKFGGVNPFDQPGVEAYKKEMFRLLGRP